MATHYVALPLTYRETDSAGAMTWGRQGAGPHVTPAGMEGDGYGARYTSTTIPAWMSPAAAPLTLHASATVEPIKLKGTPRDTLVFAGADTSAANPKLELAVVADGRNPDWVYVALHGYTTALQSIPLARPQWRYQGRFPVLAVGANAVRPQGVLFIDADTVLVSGHFSDTESRCYKVRVSDGAVLGAFSFGTTTHRHIASFARNTVGDVWCVDYDTGRTLRVDLGASFTSGSAVITAEWDTSVLSRVSGLEFITVSGTEYVLIVEYATSGTPYLYVIPASLMADGAVFAIADRHKRFAIGLRTQGQTIRDGHLYVAKNRNTASVTLIGWIERYDAIATVIANTADGATLTPGANWAAPSAYPEDLAFHPTTGELWTLTEGWNSPGDYDGWLGLWSSPLDGTPVENHYTASFNGAGTVSIQINGRDFDVRAWSLSPSVTALSIGGPPQAAPGMTAGFMSATVRNVILQDGALSADEYVAAVTGAHEPNTLAAIALTLSNPDAEAGNTAGWTSEIGALAVRSSNPAPYGGGYYFSGGAAAQTIARQRLDLLAQTGLSAASIDAGGLWLKLRWRQSSYDSAQDPGAMGLRLLDGALASLAEQYAGIAYVPNNAANGADVWYPRSLPLVPPAGARHVDVLYRGDRTSGTNLDHYVDAINATLYWQQPAIAARAALPSPLASPAARAVLAAIARGSLPSPLGSLGATAEVVVSGAVAMARLPSPLGAAALLSRQVLGARSMLASPLGLPAAVAQAVLAARASLPSPLAVPLAAATCVRYELRGEVRDQGVLVNRRVRAYRRDTGALVADADAIAGRFALHAGFEAREHYLVPVHLDDTATDYAPPCANRVLSVLAQDAA